MRLDKYLKVSHIIKRRTQAKDVALKERILINNKPAKPSSDVNINDIIEITYAFKVLTVKVLSINEYTSKNDSNLTYEVISLINKEETV